MSSIVLIGSGNVATHIGTALTAAGHKIVQVYNRTDSGKELSLKLQTDFINDLENVDKNADFIIVSLKDDIVQETLNKITSVTGILLHTSGSLTADILKDSAQNYGVIYPVQTLNKIVPIDFNSVPLCIEGNNKIAEEKIKTLANSISKKVYRVSSSDRLVLHLAAVFACNFTNHLYSISEEILSNRGLSFNILKPLIKETANKVQEFHPNEVQTGPAVRGDLKVMNKHMELLKNSDSLSEIYKLLSSSIQKMKEKDE